MKQLIIITAILLSSNFTSTAQVSKHSLGVRFNSQILYRAPSLSYQFGINDKSRLNFNINTFGSRSVTHKTRSIHASLYYQRVMQIKGGLNWFVGAGAQYEYYYNESPGSNTLYNSLAVGPTIGLEYDFNKHKVPLLLSLDYRPSVGYDFHSAGSSFRFRQSVGLSLHYTFKDKKKETIRDL
ncbi:MAG: hypothetical protein ACI8ZM_004777 [Crocinitomix sp.]|jgi:hypothetical protein